jgi:hypothetical protein
MTPIRTRFLLAVAIVLSSVGCVQKDDQVVAEMLSKAFPAPPPRETIGCINILKAYPTMVGSGYTIPCRIDRPPTQWNGFHSLSCPQPRTPDELQASCKGPEGPAQGTDPPVEMVKFDDGSDTYSFLVYTNNGTKYMQYNP